MNPKRLNLLAWLITITVSVLAIAAWGQMYEWDFLGLTTYQLFPLFGLLAFSLMWAHYFMSAVRQLFGVGKEALRSYFDLTSGVVLVLIVAHPGLLTWQLWRDGVGLPPFSFFEYIPPTLKIWIVIGEVAFLAFLAYELRRVFSNRAWWRFVQYASDLAMLMIFFHALNLGSHLQTGWFRSVWYFYGITFIASLAYSYLLKLRPKVISHT